MTSKKDSNITDSEIAQVREEFKDYAYITSHDLGAPVRAMTEFSKILTQEHSEELSDEVKEYLSIITDSGSKLQEMMNGLLLFSRLNTMAKPFIEVDSDMALKDCLIVLKNRIAECNGQITYDTLPKIKADADHVVQLFMNVLDNALIYKSKDATPIIHVSAQQLGDMWEFSFADNGIGVAEQFRDRIFKIFQRLHTDDEYPGTGMGLALAKKIVDHHGGVIDCKPNPQGTGSIFTFTLPDAESTIV